MSPSIIVINGLILQQLASTLFRSNYIIIGITTWMGFLEGGLTKMPDLLFHTHT